MKNYIPMAPNRLIVSDITYIVIWVDEYTYEFCYLSIVLDAYTEEIVGWSVGETLSTKYPIEALVMAFDYIRHHGAKSGDTRSPNPMISVHSVNNLQQNRRQN